jgi:hypothetical protein
VRRECIRCVRDCVALVDEVCRASTSNRLCVPGSLASSRSARNEGTPSGSRCSRSGRTMLVSRLDPLEGHRPPSLFAEPIRQNLAEVVRSRHQSPLPAALAEVGVGLHRPGVRADTGQHGETSADRRGRGGCTRSARRRLRT